MKTFKIHSKLLLSIQYSLIHIYEKPVSMKTVMTKQPVTMRWH